MAWGILLDLDGTLVLSSDPEPLRRSRKWALVYENFHRTRLHRGLEPSCDPSGVWERRAW